MQKPKLAHFSVMTLLLISLFTGIVSAAYYTGATKPITIGSNGLCTVTDRTYGITITVQGTPGAVGTVTLSDNNGNPQPTATIPSGITLRHFIFLSFSMNVQDFSQAQVTISYPDAYVKGLGKPYSVYKYMPDTDSYVQLPTIVDETAKKVTATVTSLFSTILAIGGNNSTTPSAPVSVTWYVVAIAVTAIVIAVAAGLFLYQRFEIRVYRRF